MEQRWKEYFVFTKRERWAILLLFGLIGLIWSLHLFHPVKKTPLKISWTSLDSLQEKMEKFEQAKNKYETYHNGLSKTDNRRLFYFDPNTASSEEWKVLGLTEKQSSIIHNYISKGGRFRKAEDLLKIYGLRREDAERLIPFVKIKQDDRTPSFHKDAANGYYQKEKLRKDSVNTTISRYDSPGNNLKYNQKYYSPSGNNFRNKSKAVIEINHAGMEEFESLPGIGIKLAERIIKYRDKLGGYYHIDQVGETYGLQDSVFQLIRGRLNCDGMVKKIAINLISSNELSEHPYFRGKISTLLVNYRKEHGPFTTMEDLAKIPMISDQVLGKIRPYISLEEKNSQ